MVTVNRVPPIEVTPGTLEKLDEMQGIQHAGMSVEHRKEMLLQQLDLSGLEGWSNGNQVAAHNILAKYHDIFSLESGELGCTSLAKHEVWVVDDELCKERFKRIPPPMVEEVKAHVNEMLEVGAIHLSQSPWCNAIMLVMSHSASPYAIGLGLTQRKDRDKTQKVLIVTLLYSL